MESFGNDIRTGATSPKREVWAALAPRLGLVLKPAFRSPMIWLGFAATCLAAGAGAQWFYRASPPDYLLRQGLAALVEGNTQTAERLAARLERHGHSRHCRLLRGQIW